MRNARFNYGLTRLRDIRVRTTWDEERTCEKPTDVVVNDRSFKPTGRFWHSLFHRYGLSGNIFRYFRYAEVLDRVVDVNPQDQLRYCVEGSETDADGDGRLLAVSNPARPVVTHDQVRSLIDRNDGERVTYHDGVVTSHHTPPSGRHEVCIGPDAFHHRFVAEMPIDGFGQPRVFLSLLRQVCTNGMIGYSRAFRSDIRIGEDAMYTLDRALAQFDSDEGFAAMRQRVDAAQLSWASVHEAQRLRKTLDRMVQRNALGASGAGGDLTSVTGDLHAMYGVANLDSISAKRQRLLPTRCRVYDLLNFASEIATHRSGPEARAHLNAYVGTIVSEEYDLEGTAEQVPDFQDLLVTDN